jgi:hypothetical protein
VVDGGCLVGLFYPCCSLSGKIQEVTAMRYILLTKMLERAVAKDTRKIAVNVDRISSVTEVWGNVRLPGHARIVLPEEVIEVTESFAEVMGAIRDVTLPVDEPQVGKLRPAGNKGQ